MTRDHDSERRAMIDVFDISDRADPGETEDRCDVCDVAIEPPDGRIIELPAGDLHVCPDCSVNLKDAIFVTYSDVPGLQALRNRLFTAWEALRQRPMEELTTRQVDDLRYLLGRFEDAILKRREELIKQKENEIL